MAQDPQPRGLGALLQRTTNVPPPQAPEPSIPIKLLKPGEIQANPNQPRKEFNEDALQELSASLREKGLLQPLVVRELESIERQGEVKYELIAGERRWRAAQMAELDELPALVKSVSSASDILLLSLIENLQRDDLNPIEEAKAYAALRGNFKLTQEQIAQAVSKSRPYVANAMRLLDLPEGIQHMIQAGDLSVGHGKVLLSLPEQKKQTSVAARCVEQGLTVRQLEAYLTKLASLTPGRAKRDDEADDRKSHISDIEDKLRQHFGTKVRVVEGASKGRIVIEFYSVSDFDRITGLMGLTKT